LWEELRLRGEAVDVAFDFNLGVWRCSFDGFYGVEQLWCDMICLGVRYESEDAVGCCGVEWVSWWCVDYVVVGLLGKINDAAGLSGDGL